MGRVLELSVLKVIHISYKERKIRQADKSMQNSLPLSAVAAVGS